jgi:hypothetical protein
MRAGEDGGQFHRIDLSTDFLLPPSVQERLPEERLARYVAEVAEGLDLSDLERGLCRQGRRGVPPGNVI